MLIKWIILAVDLDKINLDEDNNFDQDHPDTIIHVRLLGWRSNFEKCKALKKKKKRINACSIESSKVVQFLLIRR